MAAPQLLRHDPDEGCYHDDLYVRVLGEGSWQTNSTGALPLRRRTGPGRGHAHRDGAVRDDVADANAPRAPSTVTVRSPR